jgi:hypothetical protein
VTIIRLPRFDPGIYSIGVARWYPTTVYHNIEWEFNRRYEVVSGHEYIDSNTGELKFSENQYQTGVFPTKYRTMYGYAFAYDGIMYDNTAHNLKHAMSRHFKKKTMDEYESTIFAVTDFDQYLENMKDGWHNSPAREECLSVLLREYGHHYYCKDLREASRELCLVPHKKQKLRQDEVEKLEKSHIWCETMWTLYVNWKIKYLEIAKVNKDPRIIVDCAIPNSLPRVHFSESFKKHIADKEIDVNGVRVMFCSNVSPAGVQRGLHWLSMASSNIAIVYYSDDAVIRIGNQYYNVDIASNDSSHNRDSLNFYCDVSCMSSENRENFLAIIFAKIKLTNPDKQMDNEHRVRMRTQQKCFIRPISGLLPSGIGDTTVINDLQYPRLAYAISKCVERYGANRRMIHIAGATFGFRFTTEVCDRVEKIQFLKMSPSRNFGRVIPNLGMLFRYSGCCEGNVVVPDAYKNHKYEFYQSLLTYGYFKFFMYKPLLKLCPYYDVLHKDEELYRANIRKIDMNWVMWDHRLEQQLELTPEDVYGRYNLTTSDISHFEELLNSTGIGKLIWCNLVDIVLKADYGHSWGADQGFPMY